MKRLSAVVIVIWIAWCFPAQALDPGRIHQVLSSSRLPLQDFGMLISNDEGEVFAFNAGKRFKPASVTKVITGAAALDLLGPEYKFHTQLLYDGTIVDNNLRGSLYLRSGGDPSFHSGRLPTLLLGMKNQKIKTIEQDLIIDDSLFQDINDPRWQQNIKGLNQQFFPLFVRLDPRDEDLNQSKKKIYRKIMDLEGRFVIYQNMIEPDLRTGQIFVDLMKKNGIRLKGKVKRGRVSRSAVMLAEVVSPLTKVVAYMLKRSNNFYADLLVRDISVAFGERPGTFATGIDFLTFYLDHVNVPRSEYSLNSGSGFSHRNLITPRAMVRLLQYLKNQKTIAAQFAASLPVAGVDGTLIGRMTTTSARGRVWAKTGFLRAVSNKAHPMDGAVSLAGFALPPKGKPLTFTFFYNGSAGPEVVKTIFDRICAEMIGNIPGQPKLMATKAKKKVTPAKGKKKVAASRKKARKSETTSQKR